MIGDAWPTEHRLVGIPVPAVSKVPRAGQPAPAVAPVVTAPAPLVPAGQAPSERVATPQAPSTTPGLADSVLSTTPVPTAPSVLRLRERTGRDYLTARLKRLGRYNPLGRSRPALRYLFYPVTLFKRALSPDVRGE